METFYNQQSGIDSSDQVLLIEDDPFVASMIEAVCRMNNLGVGRACSCEEALAMIQEKQYGLVLIDINLADGSGLDIIPQIRMNQGDIEIMTMTGDNPDSLEQQVKELGVSYHLLKPFHIEELTNILQQSLGSVQAI